MPSFCRKSIKTVLIAVQEKAFSTDFIPNFDELEHFRKMVGVTASEKLSWHIHAYTRTWTSNCLISFRSSFFTYFRRKGNNSEWFRKFLSAPWIVDRIYIFFFSLSSKGHEGILYWVSLLIKLKWFYRNCFSSSFLLVHNRWMKLPSLGEKNFFEIVWFNVKLLWSHKLISRHASMVNVCGPFSPQHIKIIKLNY